MIQRQNQNVTANTNVTANQINTSNPTPLTVESAIENIKRLSQSSSQKGTNQVNTNYEQTFDEFWSTGSQDQAPQNENTVTYDSGNGSQSPKAHASSPGDALLKQLKGPKKWNHQNPSYSQKVPPKDVIEQESMEESLSQNFQPLIIDDDVLSKFDEQHLKNFFFTTKYEPKISDGLVTSHLHMLQTNANRFFNVFLPSPAGQRERWDAIDFHVRFSLFVTSGRVTDPFFEEKFTEEELKMNAITGAMLHSNPTRFGTFLTEAGWKQFFELFYKSMRRIYSFMTEDENLRQERLRDWKKIMSRLVPRMDDMIDEFDTFYRQYKFPPEIPQDIQDVYHYCKNPKYKLPPDWRISIKKRNK